jgi:hypothetical protein
LYLIKVITEMHCVHSFRYQCFYYYQRVDASAGGLLVPECIIRPVVSVWEYWGKQKISKFQNYSMGRLLFEFILNYS